MNDWLKVGCNVFGTTLVLPFCVGKAWCIFSEVTPVCLSALYCHQPPSSDRSTYGSARPGCTHAKNDLCVSVNAFDGRRLWSENAQIRKCMDIASDGTVIHVCGLQTFGSATVRIGNSRPLLSMTGRFAASSTSTIKLFSALFTSSS